MIPIDKQNISASSGEDIPINEEWRHESDLQISEKGRAIWEVGITGAYLHRLNQYAKEMNLIPDDVFRRMEASIWKNYDNSFLELRRDV